MDKPPTNPQPTPRRSSPTKESVRAWLRLRREERRPPPAIDQVRAQLNWR